MAKLAAKIISRLDPRYTGYLGMPESNIKGEYLTLLPDRARLFKNQSSADNFLVSDKYEYQMEAPSGLAGIKTKSLTLDLSVSGYTKENMYKLLIRPYGSDCIPLIFGCSSIKGKFFVTLEGCDLAVEQTDLLLKLFSNISKEIRFTVDPGFPQDVTITLHYPITKVPSGGSILFTLYDIPIIVFVSNITMQPVLVKMGHAAETFNLESKLRIGVQA